MPAFYPQAAQGNLPLTPPDFVPSFDNRGSRAAPFTSDHYTTQQAHTPRHDGSMDYSQQYVQPLSQTNQQAAFPRSSGYHNTQSLPSISSYYEPMGAPILPPLRMQDGFVSDEEYRLRMQESQHSQAAEQQPAAKEEKATGGVSAKLDYEMERMTDFVSEAAQGIIQPGITVQPSFRKWVSQVLSATRLPSATILLSLHYLTIRIRDFPRSIGTSENQIYRLLAVSMILGSKFLDDNTFINRSWSDVSGIKVSELNVLEIEWLAMIGFDLHADPVDPNGVSTWLRAWKEYEAQANAKARATRLSPLDTNVQRQPSVRNSSSPYKQPYSKNVPGDFTPASSTYGGTPYLSADPWNRPSHSPAESFYTGERRYRTLEELDNANYLASFAQGRRGGNAYSHTPLPPLQSFAPTPSYYSPWNQPSWGSAHPHGCSCMMCARQYSSYMMGPGHAAQTVVG